MGIFNNSKVKKSISIGLAILSVSGLGGCKKAEKKETKELAEEEISLKVNENQEEKYNKALQEQGVIIDTEKIDIQEETVNPIVEENDALKEAITGVSERTRLENVLAQKNWGQLEESLILKMFDNVERNYDLRDINKPQDKQMYLRTLVDTVNSINNIQIAPDDEILRENNWTARADYYNNAIVLKYDNTNDLRHEIAHMENGTFLRGSVGADLGFVLEEGRASTKEGDSMRDSQWIDNIPLDVNKGFGQQLLIETCSGSYPAFEEIYKDFMRLGVDMEGLRRKELTVNEFTRQIENQLNQKYSNDLGTMYIESVNAYIDFFDMHGMVCKEENQFGQSVFEAREKMISILEHFMVQNRDNQVNREVGMTR